MIRDFSVHPKAQNNNSKILMSAFFGVAIAAFVVSLFMDAYTWVAGMVIFASLITAIFVYTKYVSVEFYYDVAVEGMAEPLFIVRQLIGRRNVTLCRVALADIKEIRRETDEERRLHKTPKNTALFVYMPTLMPKVCYRVYVNDGFDKSELLLEGSEEFFKELLLLANEARALRGEGEEE